MRVAALAALGLVTSPALAAAQQAPAADAWTREKCVRYERAWNELLPSIGPEGVTMAFIRGNEDFIAAGCSNGADACPTSDKDFELANALTITAMNFGTASTFLPFVCRKG